MHAESCRNMNNCSENTAASCVSVTVGLKGEDMLDVQRPSEQSVSHLVTIYKDQ